MTIAAPDRARRGTVAALLAGLLLTTGCSSRTSDRDGTAGTTTTASRAPEQLLSAPAAAPGASVTTAPGDTVTYHGLQRPPAGADWTALDVEVCAAAGAGSIDVSSASWRLVAADGSVSEPTSAAAAGQPTPRYPDYHLIAGGECERAWVVFGGGADPVRVAYQPQGAGTPVAAWTLS